MENYPEPPQPINHQSKFQRLHNLNNNKLLGQQKIHKKQTITIIIIIIITMRKDETYGVMIVGLFGTIDFGFDDSEQIFVGGGFVLDSHRRKVKPRN